MARQVSVSKFQEMMTAEREADENGDGLAERMADRAESTVSAMGRAQVVDVAPDGIVEAVRPAEMTPDRGDVTIVHQVTDEEPRFSGGGEADEPAASTLIPTDQQFAGKLYRDAPELANIAERLIGEHGFLSDLVNCEVRYYWRRKTGVSKGRVKIGYCKRASDLLGHFTGCDFIVWLSATTARDGKFTDRQIEAAVFHQLCHIETDDKGNFISARHDFEGFAAEVRVYGTWTEDLKLGGAAFTAAHQMGLFDVDDEPDDDGWVGQASIPHRRAGLARDRPYLTDGARSD